MPPRLSRRSDAAIRSRGSRTTSSSSSAATSSRSTIASSRARGAPAPPTAIGSTRSPATCRTCRRPSAAAACTPTSRCRASSRRTSSSARCSTMPERELRRLARPVRRARAVLRVGRATRSACRVWPARTRSRGRAARRYPMPPGAPMYGGDRRRAGARVARLHDVPVPDRGQLAPVRRPAGVHRLRLLLRLSVPDQREGLDRGDDAAQGAAHRQLPAPRRDARRASLVANGAKTAITGVEAIDPTARGVTFTADRYVLAASPIEDARLLLLSDPAGLGNSSGMVGRNLMFHYQTIALGIFDERVHGYRGRTVAHGFADFRGMPNDRDAIRSAASSRSAAAGCRSARPRSTSAIIDQLRARQVGRRAVQAADAAEPRPRSRDGARHAGRGRAAGDEPRRPRSGDRRPRRPAGRALHVQEPPVRARRRQVLRAEAARHPAGRGRALRRDRAARRRSRRRSTSWARCASAPIRRRACATRTASSATSATSTRATARCSRRRRGYNPTMTIVALALRVGAAIVNPASPASVIT